MIIFLYGPDSFRAKRKLKEVISRYQEKNSSGFNFKEFDWSAETLEKLKITLSAVSMFDEKKLVILKSAFSASPDEQEKLKEFLSLRKIQYDPDSILVFFEEDVDKKGFFDWVKKNAKMAEEFKFLSGAKLNAWIKKEVQSAGANILTAAIERLAFLVGNDLWKLEKEIVKLATFKNKAQITTDDVDLLVDAKYDANIFEAIDALGAKNKNGAFYLIHQNLAAGANELYIFSMMVYQFRNLLEIKSLADSGFAYYNLAKKTGLHPYVIKKSWQQLRNFSQDVLKKIYERLMKLDIAIKRGKIEPQTALDLIVGEIAG